MLKEKSFVCHTVVGALSAPTKLSTGARIRGVVATQNSSVYISIYQL